MMDREQHRNPDSARQLRTSLRSAANVRMLASSSIIRQLDTAELCYRSPLVVDD